jgi:hypothetical protein
MLRPMTSWHDLSGQLTQKQVEALEYFECGDDEPATLLRFAQRLVILNVSGCWPMPIRGDGYTIAGSWPSDSQR